MNSKEMIEHMFELQDQTNKKVDEDWKLKGRKWHRAIIEECVELQIMLGYKWWAKQNPVDEFQAKLEIIDMWAFGMSDIIENQPDFDCSILEKFTWQLDAYSEDTLSHIDHLVDIVSDHRRFSDLSIPTFIEICACFKIDLRELYRLYIAKTALNHHRQINGYKTGNYEKIWQGRQDNQHLEELFIQLSDVADENLLNEMTARLQQRYNAMVGK